MAFILQTHHLTLSFLFLTFFFFLSTICHTSSAYSDYKWDQIKNLSEPTVKKIEKLSLIQAQKQHKISKDFKGETVKAYARWVHIVMDGNLYKLIIKETTKGQKGDSYIAIFFNDFDEKINELRCFSGPTSSVKCG